MIMWNRKELKEKGKAAVKRNYWKSVLVSAVFEGIIGGVCFYGRSATNNSIDTSSLGTGLIIFFAVTGILAIAGMILMYELLVNPFEVGVSKFRLNALKDKGNVSDMGMGFDVSYKRNVKVIFFRDLYILLWLILFIVPGIV